MAAMGQVFLYYIFAYVATVCVFGQPRHMQKRDVGGHGHYNHHHHHGYDHHHDHHRPHYHGHHDHHDHHRHHHHDHHRPHHHYHHKRSYSELGFDDIKPTWDKYGNLKYKHPTKSNEIFPNSVYYDDFGAAFEDKGFNPYYREAGYKDGDNVKKDIFWNSKERELDAFYNENKDYPKEDTLNTIDDILNNPEYSRVPSDSSKLNSKNNQGKKNPIPTSSSPSKPYTSNKDVPDKKPNPQIPPNNCKDIPNTGNPSDIAGYSGEEQNIPDFYNRLPPIGPSYGNIDPYIVRPSGGLFDGYNRFTDWYHGNHGLGHLFMPDRGLVNSGYYKKPGHRMNFVQLSNGNFLWIPNIHQMYVPNPYLPPYYGHLGSYLPSYTAFADYDRAAVRKDGKNRFGSNEANFSSPDENNVSLSAFNDKVKSASTEDETEEENEYLENTKDDGEENKHEDFIKYD